MSNKSRVIVFVGPTASGKSMVAEAIAKKCAGEIINADARQIYRGISAVTDASKKKTGMHLYSFKDVSEPYSFAEYANDACRLIDKIIAVGHVPILVGGTGLYVDAILEDFLPPPKVDERVREKVSYFTNKEVCEKLVELDVENVKFIDLQNPRRVRRALEVFLQTGRSIVSFRRIENDCNAKKELKFNVLKIGITAPIVVLEKRIRDRAERMWSEGPREIRSLLSSGHTLNEPGMQAIGVKEISAFLSGDISKSDALKNIILCTRQYAKRQITWFKRDKSILWYTVDDDIWPLVRDFLLKNSRK